MTRADKRPTMNLSEIERTTVELLNENPRTRIAYTYDHCFRAHYGERQVIVPDQVAIAQKSFDRLGRSFPAMDLPWFGDRKIRVRLDGDSYGLWTGGTGDK